MEVYDKGILRTVFIFLPKQLRSPDNSVVQGLATGWMVGGSISGRS
jgi:hypothetical protein